MVSATHGISFSTGARPCITARACGLVQRSRKLQQPSFPKFTRLCPRRGRHEAALRSLKTCSASSSKTTIQVNVGDAIEQISVDVGSSSTLVKAEVALPLGLTFEVDDTGRAVVVEVAPGGNAEAAQVQHGDGLVACTAAAVRMVYPTANLLLGGVGRPRLGRILFPCTGQSLTKCIGAIQSNSELDGVVVLVLERQADATPLVEETADDASNVDYGFDPSIFK